MRDYFEFASHGTGYRQETLAGVTTFLSFLLKVTPTPDRWASLPPDPHRIILQLDFTCWTRRGT